MTKPKYVEEITTLLGLVLLIAITGVLSMSYWLNMNTSTEIDSEIAQQEEAENKSDVRFKNFENYFVYYGVVHYKGFKEVPEADPNTFEEIDEDWARDAGHVFYRGVILEVLIDPSTFEVVYRNTIKDARTVYFKEPVFEDRITYEYVAASEIGDPATFEYVGTCRCVEIYCTSYYKDAGGVYAESERLSSIDADSFEYLGLKEFNGGEVPGAFGYAKDSQNVYKGCGEVVEGVDPSECTVGNLEGCTVNGAESI